MPAPSRSPFGFLAALLLLAAVSGTASAAEIAGRVVGISDGDTLTVLDGARREVRSKRSGGSTVVVA